MVAKRSLLSLSLRLASPKPFPTSSLHGAWLGPRFCASTPRHTTLGLRTFHKSTGPIRAASSPSIQESIWQFVINRVSRATHRSGINRDSGGGYGYGGGGGSRGPWQRFRQRIDAIPNNVIFWGIMGLNGLVFVSWNLAWIKYQSTGDPSSYLWMRKHFIATASSLSLDRCYTLLTSCFSHEDSMHLLFNGFTFYFMAPHVLGILGNVSFLGLYLGGGIVSSLVGIAWRNYTQKQGQAQRSGAHGASGAIYSVISFFACMAPNATFLLFGIIPMPAWAMVTGIFLYDGYSAVNHQRAGTDTAGHIGGLLAGIGYFLAKRFRIF
ncbi:hypothetical protein L226DRAFT_613256 [Lentinus tigrinus ALCF2SS1-7]|uniref:Peptidase S54 rhomboid domain-containing protein n=1 Tax=Lentinus tigrinus ALCF2SS1-6 TaxID=1328759 RepID=A0A5C2SF35_9APHY|nr:hypothetical protein L227DRAFT_652074 [Lentinus tigrinus ALCF2SS1-6]RPD74392.1 hypothetical protein L226DRAFT_613256 [Lentinus tigrinus ALCF2SS1-7]